GPAPGLESSARHSGTGHTPHLHAAAAADGHLFVARPHARFRADVHRVRRRGGDLRGTMPEQRRIVTAAPENSETPLEAVQSWVTPTRLFFVRNHFPVPEIDLATWRLKVAGCVERPLTLTWDDLKALPERNVFATVECAGNGRSFLQPRVAGVPWGAGAIGHAEWTGVPLRRVLEKAGIGSSAVQVLFQGADIGTESDHPAPMHFERSLPLAKAMELDTLLAFRMNGELLDPIPGFPLRPFF